MCANYAEIEGKCMFALWLMDWGTDAPNGTINLFVVSFEKEIMFYGPKVDLTPSEFKEALRQNGGKVLDCRTAAECAEGMLPNAIQSDWMNGEVPNAVEGWDKKDPVYCYCRSGVRSEAASNFLRDQGFDAVFNVGGFSSLKE
tara:strand:- start:1207 stop:1635 length:429 start_codon:yes stop_codon:yes gene_type:complete